WTTLGALPEMLQTVWGALHRSLRVARGGSLLIRGGTSSIGLAAATLAKHEGLTAVATTRNEQRLALLRRNGADYALIDNETTSAELRKIFPDGVGGVLDLVGTSSLADSLACTALHGIVCLAGGL